MVSTIRRVVLSTLAATATAFTSASRVSAVDTFRVTHTGDSISAMAFGFLNGPGGVTVTDDVYRNMNHGRRAYVAGQTMPHSNGSTWSIAVLNISRTAPGGWVVIQDNSIDATSDWEWTKLMTDIEALTPHDVCLLGVLPGFRADVNATHAATAARRATIMGQIFQQHPCRRFVFLNQYMVEHPEQFPDGQHPNVTAQTWIRGQIIGSTR